MNNSPYTREFDLHLNRPVNTDKNMSEKPLALQYSVEGIKAEMSKGSGLHTKEQIEAVIDYVEDEFQKTLNQLPLDVTMVSVTEKLIALNSQLVGVLKAVIQERNIT